MRRREAAKLATSNSSFLSFLLARSARASLPERRAATKEQLREYFEVRFRTEKYGVPYFLAESEAKQSDPRKGAVGARARNAVEDLNGGHRREALGVGRLSRRRHSCSGGRPIRPRFRRKGFASAAIRQICDNARHTGFKELLVYTGARSAQSSSQVRRCWISMVGFAPTGQRVSRPMEKTSRISS